MTDFLHKIPLWIETRLKHLNEWDKRSRDYESPIIIVRTVSFHKAQATLFLFYYRIVRGLSNF